MIKYLLLLIFLASCSHTKDVTPVNRSCVYKSADAYFDCIEKELNNSRDLSDE